MLAVSLVGTVSCEKFLTVEPQDTIMAENYYVSRDAIRANTAVLYSPRYGLISIPTSCSMQET